MTFYTSFETMEHLPVDLVGAYLSEALRVLKNGGKNDTVDTEQKSQGPH